MYESEGCFVTSPRRETDGGMNPFDNSTSMSLTEACESSMLSSNSMWAVDSERERVRLLDRHGSQPSANQIRVNNKVTPSLLDVDPKIGFQSTRFL